MTTARFRPKSSVWWCRLLGRLWPAFTVSFWTTVRWPFGVAQILYPSVVSDPQSARWSVVVGHELVHVDQMAGPWGLLRTYLLFALLPLPVLFSGRWFLEREAFLVDVRAGRGVGEIVDMLWRYYGWPWPPALMRRWFEAHR